MKNHFKKAFLALFLLSTLMLSILPAAAFSQYPPIVMNVENCKSFITLREKPKTNAAELTKIPLNAEVTYLAAADDGFYKIEYNGYVGYALSKYLGCSQCYDLDALDEDYHNAYNPWAVVDCKEYITLRDNANGKGKDILKVPLGAVVDYLQNVKNGYCKVSYRGVTGYVQEKYLQPVNGMMETNDSFTLQVINCKQSITLRNTPSTNGKEIMQIPLGATVEYIETMSNGFYKIAYKGNIGYALSRYLG